MKQRIASILILLPLLVSCGLNRAVQTVTEEVKVQAQIVFADFNASKAGDRAILELSRINFVIGSVKPDNAKKDQFDFPVEIIFKDGDGNRIHSSWMKNPFIETYEYAGPDGHFKKNTRILDQTDFSLRYNYSEDIKSLHFLSAGNQPVIIDREIKINP